MQGALTSVTGRNAASSFVALGWLSLLSFLTIPVYIRLLGVAEWGLVAACASLQILSNFMDSGFSQIVPRLAAEGAHNQVRLQQTVTLLRRFYVGLGLAMFIVLQVAAGYLSHQWFQVPSGQAHELEIAIRIVSFQFLFQFVNNLHIGLWHGLQHQVLANVRACGFGTLKHVVAIIALIAISPKASVYVSAFACIALLELSINARAVHNMIGWQKKSVQDKVALGSLLKEVSFLSGGVLVGLLVSQSDRIILSRTVDVELFGIYTIVTTLAFAFLQLQIPITRAYFPLLVKDLQVSKRVSPLHLKKLILGTVLSSTVPALFAFWFAPEILTLWLHDPQIVFSGTTPLRLLLLAVALNSIYGCIYQVMVAMGRGRVVLINNLVCLMIVALVSYLLINSALGIVLGGIIWGVITLTQILLGAFWLYRNEGLF